jgi:hypothetical protein
LLIYGDMRFFWIHASPSKAPKSFSLPVNSAPSWPRAVPSGPVVRQACRRHP